MPALVAGIHVFSRKAWMAGTSPAMTMWNGRLILSVLVDHGHGGNAIVSHPRHV
jgi:hypothetical protein